MVVVPLASVCLGGVTSSSFLKDSAARSGILGWHYSSFSTVSSQSLLPCKVSKIPA